MDEVITLLSVSASALAGLRATSESVASPCQESVSAARRLATRALPFMGVSLGLLLLDVATIYALTGKSRQFGDVLIAV